MDSNLKNIIFKYQDLKSKNDISAIDTLSTVLNNELLYLVKKEVPNFIENYEELLERSENIISRGYKFEIKNNWFHISSPHSPLKNKKRKLMNPFELFSFLETEEELTSDQKELCLLFLSNQNTILSLNMAINLS